MLRSDTVRVRNVLAAIRETRTDVPSAEWALDAVYPEAALMVAVHDSSAARDWLDASLGSVTKSGPEFLRSTDQSACFMQAVLLRLALTANEGRGSRIDNTRQWNRTISILWRDADPMARRLVPASM